MERVSAQFIEHKQLAGTQSDAELTERACSDPDAFAALYELHYPRVFNYVMRTVMNVAIAEDIVSDAFLKAFKGLKGFDSKRGHIEAWLYRIATNTMLDHFRRRPKEQLLPGNAPSFDELARRGLITEATAGRGAEQFETYRNLHEAIDSLKEVYRLTVILHYFEEKSLKEIAEIMNCTLVTAKWRLHHARKLLAAKLPEHKKEANDE